MNDRYSPTTSESGYGVRVPASYISNMRDSSVIHPTPLRNLHQEFFDLNEEMQVYVRIKPLKDGGNSVLSVSGNHIIIQPPKDSISFKNRSNAGMKTLQKFKFNKIYDGGVSQEALFKDSVYNLVQDFLMGKNTLLFTYGATSAGKTYTMLGKVRDAGLLPRSLDVIFNSLEGKLLSSPILKPLALNEIMKLNLQQAEAEEVERSLLMRGFDLDASDTKDSISTTTSASLKDWNIRARNSDVCSLQHPRSFYSVWVSYCEIYNEQAFDLLDGCDRKKKRTPLRITEDRKGKFYVKGLKEICVRSADDAVRVVLYGKENLHFAATKLNHNSSRSHCVFTVKVIRTNHREEPSEACINMMSFVDLAGMERTTKTQSKGERLKEAGNINTSLLVLGRCIEAMRATQHNPSNKVMIPYRESKLTRILQTFFGGQGRAAMFVNVSPSALLCDETTHVLKFGALAQEVIIQPDRDPDASLFAPPIRPSKFQQYVRKSISMMSARGSVFLEASTCLTIGEGEEESTDLQDRVNELEEELARLKADWDDHEARVRDECCTEWNEVVTKLQQTWTQRYDETKARYEEFCENRVDLMAKLMDNSNKRNKKRKISESVDLEYLAVQFKDKDDQIEILEDSNARLTEMVEKLKKSLKSVEDSRAELQHEMTRLQFEAAAANKPKIQFCGPDSDDEDDSDNGDELESLRNKLAAKEALLDEAVIDFHTKNEELNKALQENEKLKQEVERSSAQIADLQNQLEKSNLLLSDANERLDVREEELMNQEQKLNNAEGKIGGLNRDLREAKRRIRDFELSLKDQSNGSMMSNMYEDLQKQVLESDVKVEKQKTEIERLNKEVNRWKNRALEGEDSQEELTKLRSQLYKTQTLLNSVQKELSSIEDINEDLKARRESLLDEVSHLKRDLELSSTERKQQEGSQSELLKENEELRQTVAEMKKLVEENKGFQSAMMEYEGTIKELTSQLEHLRAGQRERSLIEEELETLASTLGRVQIDKSRMERDIAGQKSELERLTRDLASAKKENLMLQDQFKESQLRSESLEEQLKCLKSSSENSLSSASSKLETELQTTKDQMKKEFQEQFDRLEKDNEKLTKSMLQHMKRVNELSDELSDVNEKLEEKTAKCEKLVKRIGDLETQNGDLDNVHSKLKQKEIAIKENEDKMKSVLDRLSKKDTIIEQLKEDYEQQLNEKNLDIHRLESELKSILSGHVNYKKPVPSVKIEKVVDDELEEDFAQLMVTPTPVKSRRGRAKKAVSPESAQKDDVSLSSTRSRRTLKSVERPSELQLAPPSSSKSSARKPRKNKSEIDEVSHPALSVHSSEETEITEAATPSVNSKRRLYNARCPDVLLPSADAKDENEVIEYPKRMATRSRRQ